MGLDKTEKITQNIYVNIQITFQLKQTTDSTTNTLRSFDRIPEYEQMISMA